MGDVDDEGELAAKSAADAAASVGEGTERGMVSADATVGAAVCALLIGGMGVNCTFSYTNRYAFLDLSTCFDTFFFSLLS